MANLNNGFPLKSEPRDVTKFELFPTRANNDPVPEWPKADGISRTLPLFQVPTRTNPASNFGTALPRPQGLTTVSINYQPGDNISPILERLQRPCPDLQELKLIGPEPTDAPSKCVGELLSTLWAPQLKCLVLRYTEVTCLEKGNWTSFQLTHLEIVKSDTSVHDIFTSDWLNILETQPTLQTLYLSGCNGSSINTMEGSDAPVHRSRRVVNLPYLKEFRYNSEIANCNELIEFLEFPSTCYVHIVAGQHTKTEDRDLQGTRRAFERILRKLYHELQSARLQYPGSHLDWHFRFTEHCIALDITMCFDWNLPMQSRRFTFEYNVLHTVEMDVGMGGVLANALLCDVFINVRESLNHIAEPTALVLEVSCSLTHRWYDDHLPLTDLLKTFRHCHQLTLAGKSILNLVEFNLFHRQVLEAMIPSLMVIHLRVPVPARILHHQLSQKIGHFIQQWHIAGRQPPFVNWVYHNSSHAPN
ncbi:hypothetical protein JR316_0013121 [Psilocybe cubensis]|uniref:Uncharacterized protein n=2 Tax=Psilocybe cubensis TaxID=181762 RepID=A0A8H8CHK2_PSICU|nr:hypothetical protein JR316_0013121 [Psilocybe cubensis]KAH9474657.1 hypothetical protein JR316_0013121 [Psilocybe cubensis]